MDIVKGTYSKVNSLGQSILHKVIGSMSSNADALDLMVDTCNRLFNESSKLGKSSQFKYLNCYNILQDIMMNNYPELVFGPGPNIPILTHEQELDLDQIAADLNFYLRFAAGAYGNLLYNYVLVLNRKPLPEQRVEADFLKTSRIDPKQLIYSNWQAEAYCPAHAIILLKERKEVMLLIRGSLEGGDFVTDLIATYVNFSVLEDATGKKSIRIDSSDSKMTESFKNLDISLLGDKNSDLKKGTKVLFSGKAHSGIFNSGIELYQKIRSRLDEAFSKLPKDFRLVITGHSLGGGMTSVMTFMFLIHPLPYFQGKKLDGKVMGYTYGAPPTFDKSVAPILDGHLFNLVNHYDLVPRLSFGTLKDLDLAIIALNEKEKTDDILKKEIIRFNQNKRKYEMSQEEKKILQHYVEIFIDLRTNVLVSEKLYHAGRTFVQDPLQKADKKKGKEALFSFKEVKGDDYLHDLIICLMMPVFHDPALYQEGLLSNRVYK